METTNLLYSAVIIPIREDFTSNGGPYPNEKWTYTALQIPGDVDNLINFYCFTDDETTNGMSYNTITRTLGNNVSFSPAITNALLGGLYTVNNSAPMGKILYGIAPSDGVIGGYTNFLMTQLSGASTPRMDTVIYTARFPITKGTDRALARGNRIHINSAIPEWAYVESAALPGNSVATSTSFTGIVTQYTKMCQVKDDAGNIDASLMHFMIVQIDFGDLKPSNYPGLFASTATIDDFFSSFDPFFSSPGMVKSFRLWKSGNDDGTFEDCNCDVMVPKVCIVLLEGLLPDSPNPFAPSIIPKPTSYKFLENRQSLRMYYRTSDPDIMVQVRNRDSVIAMNRAVRLECRSYKVSKISPDYEGPLITNVPSSFRRFRDAITMN